MTTSTFFPDADIETNTVDGVTIRGGVTDIWADLRAGAGTSAADAAADDRITHLNMNAASQWTKMSRGVFTFNTGPTIGDSDSIDSSTLGLVATERVQGIGGQSIRLVIFVTPPASETALASGDHVATRWGTAEQATDRTLAGLTVNSVDYNDWTLNATGLTNISKTGITKFGFRFVSDADNADPGGTGDRDSLGGVAMAEEILAGDKRPKLTVTHTPVFIPKAMVF